jgi:hypothetical protein
MAFASDIYNALTADPSLLSMTAGIFYQNLPQNFDLTQTYIIYNFNELKEYDVLNQRRVMEEYKLIVDTISPDTQLLMNVREEIDKYLIGYNVNTSTNITNVIFSGEQYSKDLERGIYGITLDYNVFYQR